MQVLASGAIEVGHELPHTVAQVVELGLHFVQPLEEDERLLRLMARSPGLNMPPAVLWTTQAAGTSGGTGPTGGRRASAGSGNVCPVLE